MPTKAFWTPSWEHWHIASMQYLASQLLGVLVNFIGINGAIIIISLLRFWIIHSKTYYVLLKNKINMFIFLSSTLSSKQSLCEIICQILDVAPWLLTKADINYPIVLQEFWQEPSANATTLEPQSSTCLRKIPIFTRQTVNKANSPTK